VSHRIPDPSARRRFVHRLTALAAGIGAIGFGLVPEARAAAAAATSPTTAADDSSLPTSYSLPSATQNALYATALNDAGVGLLLQSLPAQGRLDAPVQSSDMLFASGARTQTVVMPVTSYADGSTLAYAFYGAATNTTVSGGPSTPTLSAIVTSAGKVQIAIGGQVVDHPTHEWAPVYQAMYFPAQYFNSAVTATTTTTSMASEPLPVMLPRRARRLAAWNPARLVKTMQAGGGGAALPPAQQICINNCNSTAAACFAAAGAAAIAAALASLWCGVCIIMVIGASVAAGPGAPAVGLAGYTGCGWGCASAVAGMGATLALLDICRANYQRCVAACTPPPPPPTPPAQPPQNPDPGWPDNPFVPGPDNPIRPSAPVAA
jgi:hypothetical protein